MFAKLRKGIANRESSGHDRCRSFRPVLEALEDRLAPSITQITTGATDHRWPSLNNQGDVAYSQMVGGVWQVFKNGARVTSSAFNDQYPSISDNGDIIFFRDGGSAGLGWQVVRRSSGGSESQVEFSSRDVLSGAHRDAGRYPSISSNGVSISYYDFFSSGATTTPVRRFNVSGAGQLGGDFYAREYPDINAGNDILYTESGMVRRATTVSPFAAINIGAGTMGRMNDNRDVVTVTGNLSAPGTVSLRTFSGGMYGEPMTISQGAWADANNQQHVVFENLDEEGRRQIFRFTPDAVDIAATSLTWNTEQGGVDFGYRVTGADLTQDTTAALYWARGTSFADVIGGPVYATTIERQAGDHGPFYVPASTLGTPAAGATHLLFVLDPPSAEMPSGVVDESDESNNVQSLAIQQPTVEVLVPEQALMGQTYELQVRVRNNASVPITTTIRWLERYIDVREWAEPEMQDPPPEMIELAPGETRTLTLATFSHRWQWIPANPPTLPSIGREELLKEAGTALAELLAQFPDLPDEGAVFGALSSLITQLDILTLFRDTQDTARIDYSVTASAGFGRTFEQTRVTLEVPVELQQHLRAHVLFFILAEEFETGIAALDFFLRELFRGLAQSEYQRALGAT